METFSILSILEDFFRHDAPLAPGEGLIVAFSGGPDSTALLLGLTRVSFRLSFRLTAAHLDHAMDPGSAERAAAAEGLAAALGVPFVGERREVPRLRRPGESPEAAARRVRYGFLEEVRARHGARWIATAHHRDDQAETVLLRLLFGSGLEGLAGIRPVHGAVVRPLLGVSRQDLRTMVEGAGLEPVRDPTNLDLRTPRNRMRTILASPSFGAGQLARVAGRAGAASAGIERHLSARLNVQERMDGVAVGRAGLEALPEELLPFAFAWLHRLAGAPHPAGTAARSELLRQLSGRSRRGRAPACDAGGGWRWEASGDALILRRSALADGRVDFSYTVEIPGAVEIPEIAVRVGLARRPVEPWMFEGAAHRAALALPFAEGGCVTVRNRRPGDRIHPLGATGSRKLKDLLIDRRVPRRERERLPLICVGERIAWVPGVTIDQRFRIDGNATVWVAEVITT